MPKKLTYEFVKQKIEEGGEELLSPSYDGNQAYLQIRCASKLHIYPIRYYNHHSGRRCPDCAHIALGINNRGDLELVKKEIHNYGDVFISHIYENGKLYIDFNCKNAHLNQGKDWQSYRNGSRCGPCGNARAGLAARQNPEELKAELFKNGDTLISFIYKKWRLYLDFICSEGHFNKNKAASSYKQGHCCSKCARGNRKWENSVYQTLLVTFFNLEQNVTGMLKRKSSELDILDCNNLKAIELDGPTHYEIMWFDKGSPKRLERQQKRDLRKNQECLDAGIKLLRVKYSEYMKDPEGSLAKIIEFLS